VGFRLLLGILHFPTPNRCTWVTLHSK
jgi:hypothetical protein